MAMPRTQRMRYLIGCMFLGAAFTAVPAWTQAVPPAASSSAKGSAPAEASKAPLVHTTETPDLVRETQQTIAEEGFTGLLWWIPFEFWERTGAAGGSTEALKVLKDYTVLGVFVAKVSPLGTFTFASASDLHSKIVLRDDQGVEYNSLPEVAPDAKMLADLLRPVLANALGKAGESFELVFFPAKDKSGKIIADAKAKGQFDLVLKDLVGVPASVYQWRLPLTSLLPPRYCPAGKERVNANWDYCPWHGVSLSGAQPSPNAKP